MSMLLPTPFRTFNLLLALLDNVFSSLFFGWFLFACFYLFIYHYDFFIMFKINYSVQFNSKKRMIDA